MHDCAAVTLIHDMQINTLAITLLLQSSRQGDANIFVNLQVSCRNLS